MSNFDERTNHDVAIIPKGTVINGNIIIEGKLEMYGTINGDIESKSRVNICGDINGNIKAEEIFAKDSFIEGNIECERAIAVRENTVVLGDISADSLVVDGAIQGNLDIKGCVTVGNTAIIDSDIKAKSIEVSNGAALNGHCSLCYADITPQKFFPETEAVVEKMPVNNKDKKRKVS